MSAIHIVSEIFPGRRVMYQWSGGCVEGSEVQHGGGFMRPVMRLPQ